MKIRGFEKVVEQFLPEGIINLPKRATRLSAGYDFFAPEDIKLAPGESTKVATGIKAYMQPDEVLMLFPRSGLGFKYFVRLANTVGVVDADYYGNESNDGHIFVKIRNEGDNELFIPAGDAFAQGIFIKYLLTDDDSFDNGAERIGGEGSTTGK